MKMTVAADITAAAEQLRVAASTAADMMRTTTTAVTQTKATHTATLPRITLAAHVQVLLMHSLMPRLLIAAVAVVDMQQAAVDMPAVVVCQAPVDFEDFARIGVRTRYVMPKPENIGTKGEIVEIVNGVIRGSTISQSKLDEIVSKVKKHL